jgi:outer membrane protein OmpA-like peptidoglycan-associated protein
MKSAAHRRAGQRAQVVWTAALGAMVIALAQPAAAQDETSNPNVLIDYSVLDDLTDGAAIESSETLPAPAGKPVSRMLISSDGTPVPDLSSQSSDATVSSVPTTPVETSELDAGEAEATEAAAAAEDLVAAAGAPDVAAEEPAAETANLEQLIDGQVRIAFAPGSAQIPESAMDQLNGLLQKMNDDPFMRVQVLAYAAGTEDTVSVARRVSLGRAMAIRKFLADQGVTMDRMDVRALGGSALEEPFDRVDIIPLPQ